MLLLYPENATERLEFDKVRSLLLKKCRTENARQRVNSMRFLSKVELIEKALHQTNEYKITLDTADYFPNDFTNDLSKELKLLMVKGAALRTEDLASFRSLALNFRNILSWFKGKKELFPNLFLLIEKVEYEKEINRLISEIIDDAGKMRNDASNHLLQIRTSLEETRHELRRTFEGALRKHNKLGYLADTGEGFLNGRRTLAVLAEYKRIVKGILHGTSDSQKTVFIEPESTIELNNEILSLEFAERKEIQKILVAATQDLAVHQPVLENYYRLSGIFDFIRSKALLAKDMDAIMPRLHQHPSIQLINAYHPLLLLQNKISEKNTIPLNVTMDRKNRILMISGPNAGGKTVSMKTIGLLQLMLQSGLLIPADPKSEMGTFKQIMVHIGDTQSIENELSTYSAHLQDMKYFLDFANGKTLFFIDELGSGSDPNLGGAFAEAIVEELSAKNAFGIITTHYLNLKIMAGKVPGIFNGAMSFDEKNLLPLYQLVIGKPGSSYTFAIAQRSGLSTKVIERAREITDSGHFKLDKILHQTEKQSVSLNNQENKLQKLISENEQLKQKYEDLTNKEKLKQHFATLKLQNQIKKEELDYLKDTERKLKQIIQDWKKAENKQEAIQSAEQILFRKKQIQHNAAAAKKADKRYRLTGNTPVIGDLVRNTINHQIGRVTEINDKKAIVKIGNLPFTVSLKEWVVVELRKEN